MKGVDDFMYLLVIAIVLVAVLFAASLYIPPIIIPPTEKSSVISEFTVGSVGFTTEYSARTVSLGSFTIGEIQEEMLKSSTLLEVSSSSFKSEKESFSINIPKWLMDLKRKVKITFNIRSSEMTPYGDLVIIWNGKEFYRAKDNGNIEVEIGPEYIRESNDLKVYCEGPGAFFWASTIYKIRDFKAVLEYGPEKMHGFEIYQKELEKWHRGELTFYGGNGNVIIKLNGIEIYNKIPEGIEKVILNVSETPLKVGENILSFESNTSVDMLNVKVRMFLLGNEIIRIRNFNITEEEYKLLEEKKVKGEIGYNIDRILRTGPLTIKLNGFLLNLPNPTLGMNRVYFDVYKVHEGKNELEFSGKGEYEIGEVKISLLAI